MKLLAKHLGSAVALGETKYDPLIQVHENGVFVYRNPAPHMVQRFMCVDYVAVLATLFTMIPGTVNGLVFIFPLMVFMVVFCFLMTQQQQQL